LGKYYRLSKRPRETLLKQTKKKLIQKPQKLQKMKKLLFITGVIALLITQNIFAATNYVSKTGNHVLPFNSWLNAATNIQAAVDAAVASNLVLVNDGIYYPPNRISVTNDMIVKSVNGAENTIVNGGFPNQTNMCFWVDANDVIDGFTITNGYAERGGGVYCDYGGEILNSIITGNRSEYEGGGVVCYYGGVVSNCTISRNVCDEGSGGGISGHYGGTVLNCIVEYNLVNHWMGGGGGVRFYHDGIIKNCIIRGNTSANDDGGGIDCNYGSVVEDCLIIDNVADDEGGGVFCWLDAIVKNCVISNNVANNGGGVKCGSDGLVQNCIIVGNSAEKKGGGVSCSGKIRDCLIINNSAVENGGGIYSYDGFILNCTISGNSSTIDEGGLFAAGYGNIINSIVWNNTNGNSISSSSINLYNCIENWTNIVDGIITNNPKFRDVSIGNYRLEELSPCRNAGTNMEWMLTARDLDGNPRITGGVVDMGAYEYIPEPVSICYLLFIIYYLKKEL